MHKGKQVSDKWKNQGGLTCIYVLNMKDQAEMYLPTTEAIANFVVDVGYGKDVRMLMIRDKKKACIKTNPPARPESAQGQLEDWKMELSIYYWVSKEYTEHKAKVFVVILGQCSHSLWRSWKDERVQFFGGR